MSKTSVFFGGDNQVGTTMLAQSVAELVGKKGEKTLLILASGQYGTDYISNKVNFSLDDIRSNLASNNLLSGDVRDIVMEYNGISVLPGIKNISTIKYYSEEDIDKIVNSIENDYDQIIIDGGCNVQYGLNISSLKYGKNRYYVVTQQEKCLRRFENICNTILKPLEYSGKLVINKYMNNMGFYNKKQIETKLSFNESIILGYVEYGWVAEQDKSTLLKYPKFHEGINNIVNDILDLTNDKPVKKFIFKR